MTEIFYDVVGFLLAILVVFLLFEFIYWTVRVISDGILKRFARKNSLHFVPGKRRLFPYDMPGKVYGDWNGYRVEITYSFLSFGYRYVALGNIDVFLWAENPSKGNLRIYKTSTVSKDKRRNYFRDEWDEKISVESSPAAFGRTVLKSLLLKEAIYESQRWTSPVAEFVSIHKDGRINVFQRHTMLTTRRILTLLNIAKELAIATKGYNP